MSMINRIVSSEAEREAASRFIAARPFPFTMTVTDGKQRTTAQNKLQRKWMMEIAEQRGDVTPEEVRGECKLMIGVPILRAENDAFREAYDRLIRPLAYPDKLAFMMEPMDLPVTRIMTTKQLSAYLDGIIRHYGQQGIVLTMPEDMRQNPGASSPSAQPVDGAEASPPASAPSSISRNRNERIRSVRVHLIDFSRKGLSTLKERWPDAMKETALSDMLRTYSREFQRNGTDADLLTLQVVHRAILDCFIGKRTEEQAIEFISRELGCSADELKGHRR